MYPIPTNSIPMSRKNGSEFYAVGRNAGSDWLQQELQRLQQQKELRLFISYSHATYGRSTILASAIEIAIHVCTWPLSNESLLTYARPR
jgi:hypothetical protein